MSVRVTIEADWFGGELRIEADDSGQALDETLTDRIRSATARAESAAVAALNAPVREVSA